MTYYYNQNLLSSNDTLRSEHVNCTWKKGEARRIYVGVDHQTTSSKYVNFEGYCVECKR